MVIGHAALAFPLHRHLQPDIDFIDKVLIEDIEVLIAPTPAPAALRGGRQG